MPVETIPFAEHAGPEGGYGAACGLGDTSFAGWTCAKDLECRPYDVPERDVRVVGVCLPRRAEVGDPCEFGPLDVGRDPARDRVTSQTVHACAVGQVCNRNAVGFPGGSCTAACSATSAHVRCGAIAVLEPFNACLARNEPFATCLKTHTRPSGLRACSLEAPCRDDYACVQAPTGGVCVPPYFLFQLRVDGHEPGNFPTPTSAPVHL